MPDTTRKQVSSGKEGNDAAALCSLDSKLMKHVREEVVTMQCQVVQKGNEAMILCEIKSPQGRERNWWDGLDSRSISGKGRDGARSVRQHYWGYHVTGTVLDITIQRSFLCPGEGGECIHVVTVY